MQKKKCFPLKSRANSLKFKLDENIPISLKSDILQFGSSYDVETVHDEGLRGIKDRKLSQICKQEERILITLDADFLNVNLFPQNEIFGVIILRIDTQGKTAVKQAFSNFIHSLSLENIENNVVIVERKGIRIRDLD